MRQSIVAWCFVGGCLPIGHASGLLEMWRPAGSLLQEFRVPVSGPLATRRRLGAAVASMHVLGGVSTCTTVFPRHLRWVMFWRGRAQSTTACMSLSGPVGLATREPLHGCNTLPVHCHPPPRYVIMWWRGTALPFNGPASQPAGRRLWAGWLLLPEMQNLSLPHPKGLIRVGLQM